MAELSAQASLYLDPSLSCAELGTAQPQLVHVFLLMPPESKVEYFILGISDIRTFDVHFEIHQIKLR